MLHWSVVSAAAIGVAGCSPDTLRLSDNPSPNPSPYVTQNPNPGPYVPQAPYNPPVAQPLPPAAASGVERRALPASGEPPAPQPPPPQLPEVTGAVRRTASGGHWDWDGGTAVVVGPGETLESVAHRHGVPLKAIMEANGIKNPAMVLAGQRLVIPRYTVDSQGAKLAHAAAPRTVAPPPAHMAAVPAAVMPAATPARPAALPAAAPRAAAAPAAAAASNAGLPASAPVGAGQTLLPTPPVHTVASGDTLGRIAHQYHVKIKDLTIANGIQPDTRLEIGMKITVPVKTVASPAKRVAASPALAGVAPGAAGGKLAGVAPKSTPIPGKAVVAEVQTGARVATATESGAEQPGPGILGGPAFRWPLRGRVVNNFGAKVNGAANDGIDLAVPEGTAVRAAEDGVVAYAGNELKGYGNLVLVRHANGYVTAYANASELLVKRNDQIHKGQVIAKSGQSGTATNPQLHFEIRKNSAPVDPMQYLPADKTASAPL
jgi:murein DD-endopeptidase MepM/ murein hydrolase activator NlpD